jgi:hypothetical protein
MNWKVPLAVCAAAITLTTMLTPDTANAAHRAHYRVHHRTVHRVVHVAAVPAPAYYGMPGTYYPAPPFPFFLVPGPWWLPAHP